MVNQVLIYDTLLIVEISGQLINDVHLIMLVLNLPKLLKSHSDLLDHLIELWPFDTDLAIFLGLLQSYKDLF